MKRILLTGFMLSLLITCNIAFCQESNTPVNNPAKVVKKTSKPKAATSKTANAGSAQKTQATTTAAEGAKTAKETDGIHWLTLNEAEAKMRDKPKKAFIDIYTGWCGWCKRMEATTYTNAALIKYVNNNFYAIRFDAESKESFQFNGKEYHFEPQYKANTFAVELMKGQMGYPTTVFMMENFQNPNPIPGYQPVKDMEMFLLFFGDNICLHKQFDDYRKTFVSAWDKGETPAMAPPTGH